MAAPKEVQTPPAVAEQLDTLAAQLTETAKGLRDGSVSLQDTAQRVKVLGAAKAVIGAVGTPMDKIIDTAIMLATMVATHLFVEWGGFQSIPAEGSISYVELAGKIDADVNITRRVSRVLISNGLLAQEGSDKVTLTPKSKLYTEAGPLLALTSMSFYNHFIPLSSMPAYFQTFGRKEPTKRKGTIYAWSHGSPEATAWEVMNRDKAKMKNFMTAMAVISAQYPILGSYSMGWAVAKSQESTDRKLVVDVGGGQGHCIRGICEATPGLDIRRCVVEDLPEVVAAAKEAAEPEFELVGMDFLSEQPVKGALVYYIRRCLHDYGDDDCIGILKQIAGAMAADSKLLIVDNVLSDPPPAFAAAMDIMMALLSGKERTLENFEEITAAAGLRIEKVWTNPGSDAAVLECAKVE